MAKVKTNILGNLSGRIGNVSARIINGITQIAARPASFKINRSEKAAAARAVFAATICFTKAILSNPDLKEVWLKAKLKGKYLRSSMFKYNCYFFEDAKPTVLNVITPDGFSLSVRDVTFNENSIDINLDEFSSLTSFTTNEVNISFVCLRAFYNPFNKYKDPIKIIVMTKEIPGFNFKIPFIISFPVNFSQKDLSSLYANSIIYLTAITKNAAGETIKCSSTYARNIE
ncbi:MAG: hypothetical protein KJ571_15580 [Bacteroidetes bacterium]|nr:hypothetical protein [Bacteroidota bacterium]